VYRSNIRVEERPEMAITVNVSITIAIMRLKNP
jgi:hypothetical protein